jgi:capsular polysaccharide biosynthesis protein
MSQQALDLRRSIQIVRRHRILVGVIVALGVLAGGAYARLHPSMLTATALVVLPQSSQSGPTSGNGAPDPYTATQEVIAGSNEVLLGALPELRPGTSLGQLRHEVQIGSLTPYVISVSAKSMVAADAEKTANAVANSYMHYIGSASSPVGRVSANLLESATTATGVAPLELLIIDALVGALSGALVGAIISLAISRTDRRLRERDEIANSIGAPVLASFPVAHPADAAGWTKLLEDYKPGARHTLQLQRALQQMGMEAVNVNNGNGNGIESGRSSVVILSLSSDPGALALGPQLAAFAVSQGIPTALVIGPQQDPDVTATLRTACAVSPPASLKWPSHLRVTVSDGPVDVQPDAVLTVIVAVVDGRSPRVPYMMPTTATALGVSAGAATAEQLARVAVSAAADGREIAGILVADPEPTDRTTGRIPQLSRPTQRRLPTRLKGLTTEIRR